ncbi:MAG: MFS transporter [Actinobacteria bacterium]|nr:MFS transporter [Actinomycetota bacterium]
MADEVGAAGMRPVLVLMLASSFERFLVEATGVLGPDIRDAFHVSNSALITTLTFVSILPAFASPWVGYLNDRMDRVRLAQWGTVAVGVVSIALAFSPKFWVVGVLLLLGGLGQLVNEPSHRSLITDYYPPRALGTTFTFYLVASSAIALVAGPVGGGLGQVFGWRSVFVVLAFPTLAGAWLLGRLTDPGRGASVGLKLDNEERPSFGEGFRRLAAIRSLRRTWWAAAFFGGGVVAFASLRNVFFKDVYHYNAGARGAVAAVFGLGGLVGTIVGGWLVQTWLRRSRPDALPLINGLMIAEFGVGIVLMGLAPTAWLAAVATFLLAFGAGGFAPAYYSMIGLVASPRLRGQAYSYSLLWVTLGALVVAPSIGGIANSHERVACYVLGTIVMMAGAIEITARKFVARDVVQAQKSQAAGDVDALLAVRGLEVAYGNVQILFGVDLDVGQGEIVALLGTNGAGKSTFLRAVSGLMDPIGGAVFFKGRDVSHADAVTKALLGMALVPGDRGVFPGLTVADNFRIAGWMFKGDPAALRESTERALSYFPVLKQRWDIQAGNLSGGEQQMLVLAQALLGKPSLLMIDELTLGLAPVIVEQLLATVRQLAEEGTTIVLVEQSVNVALTLAKRAVFLEKGEIRFSGPTADLLKRPDVLRAVFLEGVARAEGTTPARKRPRAVARTGNGSITKDGADRAAVLETIGVSKHFGGVTANFDVSLTLHDGEILGLLGPNGAGKTTLFDLISGFYPVDGGRILLHGEDVTEFSPDARARLGLGRSFQDSRLFPALTIDETIKVALERHLVVRDPLAAALHLPASIEAEAAVEQRIDELAELLGLNAFRNKFVSEISTGTRRMVDLACILAHEPTVILFDEPSSGIAQRETEALGGVLRRVRDLTASSLLVIEHDMPLLTGLADEVIALDLGEVVTRGTPTDVVNHPRVVAAYLGTSAEATARSGALPVSKLPTVKTPRNRSRTKTPIKTTRG